MEKQNFVECVESSKGLSSVEKEFSVNYVKQEECVSIHCYIRSMVQKLLENKHFETELFFVEEDDKFILSVEPEEYEGEKPIIGIKGKAPLGILSIKSNPRQDNSPSLVVHANYEDWDAKEVFSD